VENNQPSHRKKSSTRNRHVHQDDTSSNDGSLLKQCLIFQKELEQKFGGHNLPILETIMHPSEPFIADDFLSPYDRYDQPVRKDIPDPVRYAAQRQALEEARIQRRRVRRPTVAFRRLLKRDTPNDMETSTTVTAGETSGTHHTNIYMTTPLHEAARLGAADLVAFLLAQGGDPNFRNGYSRTALHACAGGLTGQEDRLIRASKCTVENTTYLASVQSRNSNPSSVVPVPIEICATFLPDEIFRLMCVPDTSSAVEDHMGSSRGGLLGRLLRPGHTNNKKANYDQTPTKTRLEPTGVSQPNPDLLNALIAERMDATLSILSWVQKDTGDGPSINAVDADGRTALHYASGMGRADVCMAILSNFGSMLTIVDEVGGRTPCEVASNQGHFELAAQLEARALLFVDPYGLDDDLMDKMLAVTAESNPRKRLVPPFKWFQTLSLHEVTEVRYERILQARAEMIQYLDQFETVPSIGGGGAMTDPVLSSNVESGSSDISTDDSEEDTNDENSYDSLDAFSRRLKIEELDEISTASLDAFSRRLKNDNSGSKYQDCKQVLQHLQQDSHVETFLAFFKWDVASAIKAFRQAPFDAFLSAGVPLPVTAKVKGKTDDRMCQICYDDEIIRETWMSLSACEHGFCKDCLADYIKDCAKEKTPMHMITCPHHECTSIFAKRDIELLMKDEQSSLERLYEATTENFVTVSDDLKFCPFPGCHGIVHRLPQSSSSNGRFDAHFLNYTGATCVAVDDRSRIGDGCTLTYEGVEDLEYNNCHSLQQPPKAHRFCFACGETVHWPLTCERLQKWNEKIQEEIGEVNEDRESGDFNDLAQKMWIKANTRPCPSCNVNIEKNDGCNHMVRHTLVFILHWIYSGGTECFVVALTIVFGLLRYVRIRCVCMNFAGFVEKIGRYTAMQQAGSFDAIYGKKTRMERNIQKYPRRQILSIRRMRKVTERRYIPLGKRGK
jgi:ankyrin repeat protein